jgi:hypothetical protein
MIVVYFLVMMHMANLNNNYTAQAIIYSGIGLNISMLFVGILKNPGMP